MLFAELAPESSTIGPSPRAAWCQLEWGLAGAWGTLVACTCYNWQVSQTVLLQSQMQNCDQHIDGLHQYGQCVPFTVS